MAREITLTRAHGAMTVMRHRIGVGLGASLAAAAVGLVGVPFAAAASKGPDVDIKVQVSVAKPFILAGSEGEAVMTLTPPSGVHINKYPPIRLTLEQNPPVTFPEPSIKIGLDAMPENPEDNPFEKVDPIHLKFKVGPHATDEKIPVKGKLKFYYCVAKSGYCAPGNKDVAFTVPVSAGP